MSLAEKMFNRMKPGCAFGSDCRRTSDLTFFRDLFAEDWEVLVIRHDDKNGKYDWFTLCCEVAGNLCNAKPIDLATARC